MKSLLKGADFINGKHSRLNHRNISMKTKITLSGEVASGKSTVGRLLAMQLGYDFISLGNIIRERAEREGLNIVDFQNKCTGNPVLDQEIDEEFSSHCNAGDHLVMDYRLGFRFIEDAFHVFLKISEEKAVERLKKANRPDETFRTVAERNRSFKRQFVNSYGIDYTLESHYDLVIHIDDMTTPQEIVNYIITQLKLKKMKKKIDPKDNESNIKNPNKGEKGTNREYDQNQGNRGEQMNHNRKK